MSKQESEFLELVRCGRRGCRYSVNRLAVSARPRIMAFFLRTTLQPDLAEDLTQETLLTMLGQIERLEKAESFWPWLYRIAASKLQQHYRQRLRRPMVFFSDPEAGRLEPALPQPTSLQILIRQETIRNLYIALDTLKQNQRELIDMRCFRQMSYAAIAQKQQCPVPQARIRYFRARESLRQYICQAAVK